MKRGLLQEPVRFWAWWRKNCIYVQTVFLECWLFRWVYVTSRHVLYNIKRRIRKFHVVDGNEKKV